MTHYQSQVNEVNSVVWPKFRSKNSTLLRKSRTPKCFHRNLCMLKAWRSGLLGFWAGVVVCFWIGVKEKVEVRKTQQPLVLKLEILYKNYIIDLNKTFYIQFSVPSCTSEVLPYVRDILTTLWFVKKPVRLKNTIPLEILSKFLTQNRRPMKGFEYEK